MITLKCVTITLCSLCLEGVGGECNVPGCALYLNRSPNLRVDPALYETQNAWSAPITQRTASRAQTPSDRETCLHSVDWGAANGCQRCQETVGGGRSGSEATA